MLDRMAYASDKRERAHQLIAEGRLGGAYGHLGGRPRVPRATELAARAATDHADALVSALASALAEDQPPEQRSQAAERWLRICAREATLQHREEVEQPPDGLDDLGRDELLDILAPLLAEMTERGDLPSPLVIDAEAVEIEQHSQ